MCVKFRQIFLKILLPPLRGGGRRSSPYRLDQIALGTGETFLAEESFRHCEALCGAKSSEMPDGVDFREAVLLRCSLRRANWLQSWMPVGTGEKNPAPPDNPKTESRKSKHHPLLITCACV